MTMMLATKQVLDRALMLRKEHKLEPKLALDEAYSDEIGFGSTDMLSASVLEDLHNLGLMLHHTIKR